jgi:hypothetical protein
VAQSQYIEIKSFNTEWLMMLTTVAACFDESGKFGDHKVISIGCVAGYVERFDGDFGREWNVLLNRYGIKILSGKDALNHKRPLSQKYPCLGVEERTEALGSFVSCIRKHLQVITGLATDVEAFKDLPSHFFQVFGSDPSYMTFVRTAMHVTEFTPDKSKITMICDDDEETALPFYRLYRRVKKVWPDARRKFGGIAFVDDRYLFGVQASDLVASLMRYEAAEKINGTRYDYKPLYEALIAHPTKYEPWLYNISVAIADKEKMLQTAEGMRDHCEKMARENAEEQERIRELRQYNEKTDKHSTQRSKSQTRRGKSSKGEDNEKEGQNK